MKGKQNKNQGVFSRLHKSFFSFLFSTSRKVVTSPAKVYFPEMFKIW